MYVVLFQSYVFLQPKNEIKEGFNILLYKNGITCMKKHVDAKHLEFWKVLNMNQFAMKGCLEKQPIKKGQIYQIHPFLIFCVQKAF